MQIYFSQKYLMFSLMSDEQKEQFEVVKYIYLLHIFGTSDNSSSAVSKVT